MKWLPIESAPKDKDVFLFGLAEVWKGSMLFEIRTAGGWDPDCERWMCTLYDDQGGPIYFNPSHWMALPPPPVDTSAIKARNEALVTSLQEAKLREGK